MPRKPRSVEAGLPYHVTQRGVDRQNVFFSTADRMTYLALASANVTDCEVRILAWCLMTNHVHFVIEAGRRDSLSVLLRRLNGRYAQYLNARRGRNGHLWQNRFYSCPVGPTHLLAPALGYVEANPVRAGIVHETDAYRWSSAKAHLAGPGDEIGRLLDWNFWQDAGGVEGSRNRRRRIKTSATSARSDNALIRVALPRGRFPGGNGETVWPPMELRWTPENTKQPKSEMGTEQSASISKKEIGMFRLTRFQNTPLPPSGAETHSDPFLPPAHQYKLNPSLLQSSTAPHP